MGKLNNRQKKFCQEYLIDLNVTKAAERAGYSVKTAYSFGQQLFQKEAIQAEIQRLMDLRAERTEITQDRVLKELALLGFSDMAEYVSVDENGVIRVKQLDTLKPGLSRAIKKIKQKTTFRKSGEEDVLEDVQLEFELYDKSRPLEMLGNHLGTFKNTAGEDEEKSLADIAQAIRERHQ